MTPRPASDEARCGAEAKFYVDDTEVWVTAEAIYHLDSDDRRLRLVEYRDYVADTVRTLCTPSRTSSARDGGHQGRAAKKCSTPSSRGIELDELPRRLGLVDADPLDVLVHLAWNQPLATRATGPTGPQGARGLLRRLPALRHGRCSANCSTSTPNTGSASSMTSACSRCRPISRSARRPRSPVALVAAALREAVEKLGELLYAA